jgi:thiamine biosynthesis lipoprotein
MILLRSMHRMPMPRLTLRIVAAAVAVAATAACSEPVHMERRWTVMGTYASAEVYARSERGAEELLAKIRGSLESVDATMSNWNEDSELSRLNRAASRAPYTVQDPDLFRCIQMSFSYARATQGAFDPTVGPLMRAYGFRPLEPAVPDDAALEQLRAHVGWRKVEIIAVAKAVRFKDPAVEIDLGGIAKGYALDVAARNFAAVGALGGIIDLGGNLYAWNHPPDRPTWTIGLRDPDDSSRVMATVELASRAVSTSGNYEQAFTEEGQTYGHIMSADSGRPARSDIVSATAIADGGADADALSTAMFVVGSRQSSEYLRRARRVEAILLVEGRAGRSLLVSASLKGKFEVDPAFAKKIGGRVRYLLPPQKLETADVSNLWDRLVE